MSALAASNLHEPPPKINQPPSPTSSLMFSSLPNDIVLAILSRVPKRHYPILSCVSKNFHTIVRSPEIHKLRSLYGKETLYISFFYQWFNTRKWFTLNKMEKNPTKNLFVSMEFPLFPLDLDYNSTTIVVGPEIFFIRAPRNDPSPPSLWIFDSLSGNYRLGPNMQTHVLRKYITFVGLVGRKIYVVGYDEHFKIHAEFFDLKTQTWKPAPMPEKRLYVLKLPEKCFVLDRKICMLTFTHIECYDTRDGSNETIEYANRKSLSIVRVIVIDNVLYIYYENVGLMWFDSKLRQWRLVNGLDHLNMIQPVKMAEYYGKLTYIWTESDGSQMKQVWCRMIALDKSDELEIHGTAEPSQLLGFIPSSYSLHKCLSISA